MTETSTMTPTATPDDGLYLTDVLLLCVTCRQPIKARINTPNWLRVEWISPSGECLSCHQGRKESGPGGPSGPERG